MQLHLDFLFSAIIFTFLPILLFLQLILLRFIQMSEMEVETYDKIAPQSQYANMISLVEYALDICVKVVFFPFHSCAYVFVVFLCVSINMETRGGCMLSIFFLYFINNARSI